MKKSSICNPRTNRILFSSRLSGSLNEPGNFRPLTINNTLTRVFEKIRHQEIKSFAEKIKTGNDHQFRLKMKRGTVDALSIVSEEDLEAWNKNDNLIALFLDFPEAFNTINHSLLLEKLHSSGLKGNGIHFLETCLSSRYHYREVNGTFSGKPLKEKGVTQGSVPGPLRFLIYIIDISDHLFCIQKNQVRR